MKKSLLSVVLCVAVLLSALFVMPASAAAELNLLAEENMAPTGEGSFTNENGVVTFNAAAADEEFQIHVASPLTLGAAKYIDIVVTSDIKFDLCFRDAVTDKWIFGAGDFCWAFEGNESASEPLKAGQYAVRLDMTGAYTWNNTPYENATIDAVMVIAKEPGKIVVSELVQTDGSRNAPLLTTSWSSPRFEANAAWTKIGMLNSDPSAWGSVDATQADANTGAETVSSAVIAAEGNGIAVSATNGLWPAATYDYATPYLVDYETTAIEVSFSIHAGKQSKLLLFFGESSNANWESEEFSAMAPLLSDADLNAGNYVLNLMLKDLVPAESVDANGKVKLNGIKAFAIGTDKCVTVNAMNLLVVPEKNENVGGEDLGVNDTTPPAGSNTVVTPNGNTNTGNTNKNPGTGDNTNAVLFVIVAAAAAGVVTLSVVSKKAKAN